MLTMSMLASKERLLSRAVVVQTPRLVHAPHVVGTRHRALGAVRMRPSGP